MGRYIVRLDGIQGPFYLEWSSVVDAPTSVGMERQDFIEYYLRCYGRGDERARIYRELMERLDRCDRNGTSALAFSKRDVLAANRAGPDESKLTEEELYSVYCLKEAIRDGWMPE